MSRLPFFAVHIEQQQRGGPGDHRRVDSGQRAAEAAQRRAFGDHTPA